MEATFMKALGVISTTALFLILGVTFPAFAQEEHHQQEAKPEKQQEQAKPAKQEQRQQAKGQQEQQKQQQQQAKPARQEQQQQAKGQQEQQQKQQQQAKGQQQQQDKAAKQQEQQQTRGQQQERQQQQQQAKSSRQEQQQQVRGQQHEQAQGQWAHNGQKDSRGHEYNENRFGREHHARFQEHGGRYYDGRREYSYGGYWFYAAAYPAWFYREDVYFIMGADGLWYAVAYDDPSLTLQVDIS